VKQFVRDILHPHADNRFLADLLRFQARVAQAGMWNSLAQTLLKITSPGVPDMYQGTELWDFSLVDPDNRHPVDFAMRVELLEELQRLESKGLVSLVRDLVAHPQDGRIKLYVTYKALNFRRIQHNLFTHGAYVPLTASGGRQDHVVAFARHFDKYWALVAVPRLVMKLSPAAKPFERLRVRIDRFPRLAMRLSPSDKPPVGKRIWKESLVHLPDGAPADWQNVFTGEALSVSGGSTTDQGLFVHALFRRFPVALLVGSTTA
jgi:(1->4)-alpha-D-glucan 1-alpha-D-glucosylmutase